MTNIIGARYNPAVANTPDAVDLAIRLDRIQKLTDELAKVRGDAREQQVLTERIYREILAAKRALLPVE